MGHFEIDVIRLSIQYIRKKKLNLQPMLKWKYYMCQEYVIVTRFVITLISHQESSQQVSSENYSITL